MPILGRKHAAQRPNPEITGTTFSPGVREQVMRRDGTPGASDGLPLSDQDADAVQLGDHEGSELAPSLPDRRVA